MAEAITCPRCGMTSHNPTDIAEGYCGQCHDTTSGRFSALAMADFVATGEIPEWRQRWLESQAVDEAVKETLQRVREGL